MKKIFITGEEGCIARYLDRLLPKNEFKIVWGHSNKNNALVNFKSTWNKGLELDICDYDLLKNAIIESDPDIIIHTAGFVDTVLCESEPKNAFLSNGYGAFNVAKICKERNIKLLYFSTTAIFDPIDYHGNMITNNTKITPKTIYGVTKYSGELICKSLLDNLIVVRPCFVYGGIEDGHSSISRLIKSSILKQDIKILLSNEYKKDFMRIEDLISAIIILLNLDIVGDFNISLGQPKFFNEIVDILKTVTGITPIFDLVPEKDYMKSHIVDNSDIKEFGWIPKISLEEGVKLSYLEIKNNLDEAFLRIF